MPGCTLSARLTLLAILCAPLAASSALAAWPHDPNVNVPISTPVGDQTGANAVSDGAGGAIFVWTDSRSSINKVYAQRVSAAGVPMWTADGVLLCTASGAQTFPAVLADGAGGVIVVWQDARTAFFDIFGQRVNSAGLIQWGATGQPICQAVQNQTAPRLVADGAGGAIIAWTDVRGGSASDIYAQRVNGAGTSQWTTDGVPICQATNNQLNVAIAGDGAAGAIIAWQDMRTGTADIYAQRVNGSGVVQWTTDGNPVCTAANPQNTPQIVADGSGGAIVTWVDFRGLDSDIYAQHVSSSGGTFWTANGIAIDALAGAQTSVCIASDGSGGAILGWSDGRSVAGNIFAQRVSGSGIVQWVANGVALAPTSTSQASPVVVADGLGGAFLAWTDYRNPFATDVYAQRITATGAPQWAATGVAVSTAPSTQETPALVRDTAGGAILAWEDFRNGSNYDQYAQRVDQFGYLGNPEPVLASVNDVPNDQGGKVKLAWNPSYLDGNSDPNLAAYDIYTSVPGSAATAARRSGARLLTSFAERPAPGERAYVVDPNHAELYAWQYVGTVSPAHFLSTYGYVATTTGDSTSLGNPLSIYMVVGRNSSGSMYWLSAPDSGYSVDNLAPIAPAPFDGAYSAGATHLHWGANQETDLAGYRLYRGNSAGFTPSLANLVVAQADTGYVNVGPAGGYFKLSAVDIHGNESPFALLTPGGTTAVGTPAPYTLALSIASANPGRGEATLRFALPQPGPMRLAIYDLAGREVRVLANGAAEAGERMARWDGRDAAGRTLAGGIYLVRLSAAGRQLTTRLVLLR